MEVKTTANLTCPHCEHVHQDVEMPTDACQHFFKCEQCEKTMTPKERECCVFCSYADSKCPPKQLEEAEKK